MAGPETQTTRRPPGPRAFSCPNCGGQIEISAVGISISAACGSCGSIIDVANENLSLIVKAASKQQIQPKIPLGSKGKLQGHLWKVIGFMQRSDVTGAYLWEEYLLFNPYQGFRWLTQQAGHWALVRTIHEKPEQDSDLVIRFHDQAYSIFERGQAIVRYVLGEFYWRVKVGEAWSIEDYICPPYALSHEKNKQESIWSWSEYIEPKVVEAAFGLKMPLPERIDVGPSQPVWATRALSKVFGIWGLSLCAMFVILIVASSIAPSKRVFSQQYSYSTADPEKNKVTSSFEIKGRGTAVEVGFQTSLNNNWLELSGELVNEVTGEDYEFEIGNEYYSGYDSDGSWSEGSNYNTFVISGVPGGRYHLNFQANGVETQASSVYPVAQRSGESYTVIVNSGVILWGNYLWAIFLISLWPCLVWLISRNQEMNRWSHSDFTSHSSLWDVDTGEGDDE
jgi:hypothetical protein